VTPVPKVEGALPYAQRWGLLLFDHASNQVREIPIELPASVPEGETRTVVVDALDGRRVTASTTAPDGYQYDSDTRYGGTGIVGDLFGMGNHYQRRVAVSRSGRRVELDLPAPYRDSYGAIYAVGWIVDGSRR
jgi:hypothetical protein